jgi:hypothetical protein
MGRMTSIRRSPSALVAVTLMLAACGSGTGSPAQPASTGSTAASSAPSVDASPGGSVAGAAGQTDTDWGRIWDGLPSAFPTIPGATPDEEPAGDPASAVFVVDGTGTQNVATLLQTELQKAGFTADGSTEPLEDGSYVLDMTGTPDGCMLRATVKPTGGVTTVTILYGTGCPFD